MKATCSSCRVDRELRLDGTIRAHMNPGVGQRTCPGSHRSPYVFTQLSVDQTGVVVGSMSRNQMIAALGMLSVRHPQEFSAAVAWAMESDARTARYLAHKEAEVAA